MTSQPVAPDELFAELRARYAVTDEISAGTLSEIHQRRTRSRRAVVAASMGVVVALVVVITVVAGGTHHSSSVVRIGGAQPVTRPITIGNPPVVVFAPPPRHPRPRLTASQAFARFNPTWKGRGFPGGDKAYLGSFSAKIGQVKPGLAYGYRTPAFTCHRPPGVAAPASDGGQCARWTFLDANTGSLLLAITQKLSDSPSPSTVTPPLIRSSLRLAEQLTGAVAYKCGDSICLMNPDATGQRTVNATFPEWDAAWSPDGQRLAFRGYYATSDGSYAVYVVDADGCHASRLPGTDGGLTPTWSPDGRQIAFGSGSIRVIDANGQHLHAVTNGGVMVHDRYVDSQPSWSPSGQIAFVRANRGDNREQIYTVRPDGTHPTALTAGGAGFFQPAWAPTGSQLAMVETTSGSMQIGAPMQIDVANADGTSRHSVSPPSWSSYSPTWTPDGRVAFLVRSNSGADSTYIVNPDGTHLRELYANIGGQAASSQLTWGNAALPAVKCTS